MYICKRLMKCYRVEAHSMLGMKIKFVNPVSEIYQETLSSRVAQDMPNKSSPKCTMTYTDQKKKKKILREPNQGSKKNARTVLTEMVRIGNQKLNDSVVQWERPETSVKIVGGSTPKVTHSFKTKLK